MAIIQGLVVSLTILICITIINASLSDDLRTCPYPRPENIPSCLCKTNRNLSAFVTCYWMDQNVGKHLAASFRCMNKVHSMELNMWGEELHYNLADLGRFEFEYFHLLNVSSIKTSIDVNLFFESSETLKEVTIQTTSEVTPKSKNYKNDQISYLTLYTGTFANLTALKNIHLETVYRINTRAFDNLESLTKLDLSQKGLVMIATEAFVNLTSLTLADFTYNHIGQLNRNIFWNAPNLSHIDLSNNMISSLANQSFKDLPALTKLDLSNNKISSIDNNALQNLPNLISLNFIQNDIEELGTFLENLQSKDLVLTLTENKIKLLPQDSFEPFIDYITNQAGDGFIDVGNQSISQSGNQSVYENLQCGCDLQWLMNKQNGTSINKFHNAKCEDGHNIREIYVPMLEQFCPTESCIKQVCNTSMRVGATVVKSWMFGKLNALGPQALREKGEVTSLFGPKGEDGMITVRWQNGYENSWIWGLEGKSDVNIFCKDGCDTSMEEGSKVVRDEIDWIYANQDGGPGFIGTVFRSSDLQLHVIWDPSEENARRTQYEYRWGQDGKTDVKPYCPKYDD